MRAAPPPVVQDADLFALGLRNLLAAVETVRADVVTQVRFASGGLDGQGRRGEEIVRAVHATLRRGLLVLLNGHENTPKSKRYLNRSTVATQSGQHSKRRFLVGFTFGVKRSTFIMTGRNRKGEKDLVLEEPEHVEVVFHLDRIEFIVFQLVVRNVLPCANRLEYRTDRQIPSKTAEATLTAQHQPPADRKMQSRSDIRIPASVDPVLHRAIGIGQLIAQSLQSGDFDLARNATTFGGELEHVRDVPGFGVLVGHKPRMILFFSHRCQSPSPRILAPLFVVRTHRPMNIVLASTSPYRKELLERLRLPFKTIRPETDETARPGEHPVALAERLAADKARAGAHAYPAALIIGSDQVAYLGDRTFGKPGTVERAVEQLWYMSGKEVVFHTAVALLDSASGRLQCEGVPTRVRFRTLSDREIRRYVEREMPLDCAGSAKSEGLGIALLEALSGDDPTALVGLPLIALSRMLRNEGVELP